MRPVAVPRLRRNGGKGRSFDALEVGDGRRDGKVERMICVDRFCRCWRSIGRTFGGGFVVVEQPCNGAVEDVFKGVDDALKSLFSVEH